MANKTPCLDISGSDFKEGMRQLAASVSIITVIHKEEKDGLTATAACSVSEEPPQLLICVNRKAGAHDLIIKEEHFGLNVLARDQENIAKRFAGLDGTDRKNRFGLGTWTQITTGAPILKGALANFDCRVEQTVPAGSHTIFIGRIVGIFYQEGTPLIYGAGQFTGLII